MCMHINYDPFHIIKEVLVMYLRIRPCFVGNYSIVFGSTVNREYFDVKIFSDSMACAKIKCTKYMHNINDNAVQGHLSENYLIIA